MPTYEYRCASCGNRFDVFLRFGEEPLRVCQRCGGQLRKVFHPAGIVFKGSGFYATDSRAKAKKASGDGKGGSKSEPSTSQSGAKKETGTSSGKKAGEGSSS